ncbi:MULTISPECIES: hypothetical protein [Streptomyces]|uniref:hypothetical protein n=1 Tax=Streptomyces TaxID=1883 RepID=UPI00163D0714|nr:MULTISPECIES: hypothetical protein [Streptomyces]MBC2878150.1 hypothetical protein [Streptomyces sp. TYQ1024]UBI39651.1 hypothetical protein K7I03_26400 [Streptomyces mobaraensis]UKW32228.1 hypothetical protein MCU78_26335 [Streptomyces sp. TYQ1024]
MEKHPPQEPAVATVDTPTAEVSRRTVVRRWLVLAAAAALLFWACTAVSGFFENLNGGPVRTAADYRTQDIRTREAGKAAVAGLRPGDADAPGRMSKESSTSCVDDLGADGDGVTRDQPRYAWSLDYTRKADYLAGLDRLRTSWRRHGWKVEEVPDPGDADRPTPRWPEIRTVADHGITLSMGTNWYTNKPVLSADGGCVRYRTDQGVTARKTSGAADGRTPAREGTVTYDDGVRVSIGPVRPFTPPPGGTGDDAPAAHTYLVPVTVTNGSGAPVELRGHDIGSFEHANPGVRRLTGFPAELGSGQPEQVTEGESKRLEFVYTAEKEPSHLEIQYGPGAFHRPCPWTLSIP